MPDELILVSRVPGRRRREVGWWLYLGGTMLLTLGVMVRGAAADPANAPYAVGFVALLGAVLASALVQRTWVDPAGGRLLHRRVGLVRWEVAWAEARVLRLRHNFSGMVWLQVRGPHRIGLHVPVAGDDIRGPRGQPPDVLRRLAHEIRRWAPVDHHGVADVLEAQANHLEQGRSIRDSPVLLAHGGPAILS